MRKIIIILTCISTLLLTACNNAEKESGTNTSNKQEVADNNINNSNGHIPIGSIEDALQIAAELESSISNKDYESFKAFYKDESIAKKDFDSFMSSNFDKLDKVLIRDCAQYENLHYITIQKYLVTGTIPNTQMQSNWINLILEYVDGEYLVTQASEEDITGINEAIYSSCPEDFIDAIKSQRASSAFNDFNNFMWLTEDVYEGTINSTVNAVWKNEDSSYSVMLYIANGSENILIPKNIEFSIETQAGVLLSESTNVESLLPKTGGVIIFNVPKENIITDVETIETSKASINITY